MEICCRIQKPFYDWNGRKYLELDIDGKIIQVKVPFRYNRVMCRVDGIRPVQEFKKGETIHALLEKKIWNKETFWILHGVREVKVPILYDDRGSDPNRLQDTTK